MNEAFLYYLWKFKLYQKDIVTQSGEMLEIIHPGQQNMDAGADFFNARIRIGDTRWAGNVEIHVNAGDWQKHGHTGDQSYDNTILHVVFDGDFDVIRSDQSVIPVLQLKGKFDEGRWLQYEKFILSQEWIPCANQISEVDEISLHQSIDRMLTDRMERKVGEIDMVLKRNKGNWEESFYQQLARNFGFKTNAVPFEMVSQFLSLQTLARHKNNWLQTEALLFGVAGLLGKNLKDEFAKELYKEFIFLRSKFKLSSIDSYLWKFARMHPAGFPTVRLAQFAHLIYKSSHLFSKILATEKYEQVHKLFEVSTSEYWKTHYVFEKETESTEKHFGRGSIDNILINTLAPFLFYYGKQHHESDQVDKAIRWLEECPAESNSTIRRWKGLGLKINSAYESQALLQLKNEYCDEKKCLICSIGLKLLEQK